MAEIWVGSSVRFSLTVKNASDVLVDPGTLKIEVYEGNMLKQEYTYVTDAEIVRDSLGTFHCDYTIPGPAGTYWRAKWISTGVGEGADVNEFKVLSG